MNKLFKWGFIICIGLVLVGVGFAVAAVIQQYFHPSTATGQTVEITSYLENVEWTNNTAIDWGAVNASTSYYDLLNVQNTGQLSCTVTMHTTGLQPDWTQTWSVNGTVIAPGAWANGTLTLTTGSVAAQTYNWNTIIKATQT